MLCYMDQSVLNNEQVYITHKNTEQQQSSKTTDKRSLRL